MRAAVSVSFASFNGFFFTRILRMQSVDHFGVEL